MEDVQDLQDEQHEENEQNLEVFEDTGNEEYIERLLNDSNEELENAREKLYWKQ